MKYSYKIDTKLLPKVWVTWWTAGGKQHWLNCQTGKRSDKMDSRADKGVEINWRTMKDDTVVVKSGSPIKYAYVKYHKGIDMLEVAAVGMKTTRAAEARTWEYLGDRFFIDRDKNIFNQDGHTQNRYFVFEYHTAYSGNELLGMLNRLNYNNYAIDEFQKFIGGNYFTIGNGRTIDVEHFWHIQEWYKTSQKPRGKGKEQKLVDALTAIELSDTTGFAEKYPTEVLQDGGWCRREFRHIAYFERIDDNWSVIRQLQRNGDNTLDEVCRIYINDNGKNRIATPGKEGWITSAKPSTHWSHYYKLVNTDEAIEKCPRIKYALNALSFVEKERLVDALISTMKFPEIEQFLKLGCRRAANCLLNNTYPKAEIKRLFGDYYNDKEKSILKKVGLTKRQLDFFMEQLGKNTNRWLYSNYVKRALAEMRRTFGNDLSYLDDSSYQKYLVGFTNIEQHFYRGFDYYANATGFDKAKFVKNLMRLGEKREEIYGIMHDTLSTYTSLNAGTHPAVDWYFDDCSDVIRMHDALVALKNEQDAERRAVWDKNEAERRKKEEEKRIKIDKERKQYEYEDDAYIIRLPIDSNEIIREGNLQHICIGGYTSRHANGETNLFFLRKKSEPEFPFYAIEMNKFKEIVQIHGSCNRWLGCNPEAIPTVVRWLRKNDIRCDEKILTCKATGYGRTNDYVPMPVVN